MCASTPPARSCIVVLPRSPKCAVTSQPRVRGGGLSTNEWSEESRQVTRAIATTRKAARAPPPVGSWGAWRVAQTNLQGTGRVPVPTRRPAVKNPEAIASNAGGSFDATAGPGAPVPYVAQRDVGDAVTRSIHLTAGGRRPDGIVLPGPRLRAATIAATHVLHRPTPQPNPKRVVVTSDPGLIVVANTLESVLVERCPPLALVVLVDGLLAHAGVHEPVGRSILDPNRRARIRARAWSLASGCEECSEREQRRVDSRHAFRVGAEPTHVQRASARGAIRAPHAPERGKYAQLSVKPATPTKEVAYDKVTKNESNSSLSTTAASVGIRCASRSCRVRRIRPARSFMHRCPSSRRRGADARRPRIASTWRQSCVQSGGAACGNAISATPFIDSDRSMPRSAAGCVVSFMRRPAVIGR